MNIQKIQNTQHKPSFGTYLGINMQEKVMLAKQRNAFSKEQLTNLEKIEEDGFIALLELYDKYVIKTVNNKKGIMTTQKVLNLVKEGHKVELADVTFAYDSTSYKNKLVFFTNKFLKIFNDDFNLAQKIEQAWEKLSSNKL